MNIDAQMREQYERTLQDAAELQKATGKLIAAALNEFARQHSAAAAIEISKKIDARELQLRLVCDWPLTHLAIAGLDPRKGADQDPIVIAELHLAASRAN